MHTLRRMLMAAAAGATVAHFWDPDRGRSRRARVRDQVAGKVRRSTRRVERLQRRATSDFFGLRRRVEHAMEARPVMLLNDTTLADKVRTELLGLPAIPKGAVSIDVHSGIVSLRGQVKHPEDIRTIEQKARRIDGVMSVHNLLHAPGEPAPNKVSALRASARSA